MLVREANSLEWNSVVFLSVFLKARYKIIIYYGRKKWYVFSLFLLILLWPANNAIIVVLYLLGSERSDLQETLDFSLGFVCLCVIITCSSILGFRNFSNNV